jgi:membrane-bound ClpP family serine protease
MGTATVVFLVIGGLGVLLLALGLLGAELFDLDGLVPMESVAAAMATFGFAAAIASASMDARTAPALLGAAGIGAAAAVPAGWIGWRLARAAERMPTDATPARDDLVGMLGVVVTPIPERGFGEVRVSLGGQPVKLNATAERTIPLGTQIFVIAAPSETSVLVERVPSAPDGPAALSDATTP